MQSFQKWLYNNSLSLIFFVLFVGAILVDSVAGLSDYNQTLTSHGRPAIGYFAYLGTGNFLAGLFSNWQAAVLQLGCLIVFAAIFHQKGASHSLRLRHDPSLDRRQGAGQASWLYRNSLSLAFALLFALAFLGHLVFGTKAYNETLALSDQSPVSVASYAWSASFWSKTAQTWQAEFVVMGLFLVLSIYLRQQGSAESKPVLSRDDETGETNK